MANEFPESYKDPQYAALDAKTEKSLGLPSGILSSIRLGGERSNHSAVSEAGAKSVYQFIPSTRNAILNKYGIDVLTSPANASEGAGLLLKEGLDRNNGDAAAAVGEYHGGLDRSNWGARTKAYINRVMSGLESQASASDQTTAPEQSSENVVTTPSMLPAGQSTFDRVSAAMGKPTQSALAGVYQAYQSGQMPEADAKQFEADVNAGHIMLPRGASLKVEPAQSTGTILPDGVAQAYASGTMPVEDRQQLEQDVNAGVVKLPAGVALQNSQKPGLLDRIGTAITGSDRETRATRELPEIQNSGVLAGLDISPAKMAQFSALLAVTPDPKEVGNIAKTLSSDLAVAEDEKGNLILANNKTGVQAIINKPGLSGLDIAQGIGLGAAFTPAGRASTILGAGLKGAATQAGIEAAQGVSGGEFNPADIATAGALGAAVPAAGRVLGAVKEAAKPLVTKLTGGAPAEVARAAGAAERAAVPANVVGAEETPAAIATPIPATQSAPAALPEVQQAAAEPVQLMGQKQLVETAKSAAEESAKPKTVSKLVEQVAPDEKTLDAAKRIGVDEYLTPGHITTNQAYRELEAAAKATPGSEAHAAEVQALNKVGQKADDLISKIGGSTDASQIDASVKKAMQTTQTELESKANDLYDQVRNAIPAKTGAPARNVLGFIEERAKNLGGTENLSSMEKSILKKLTPKNATNDAGVSIGKIQPTYTLLDDVRKEIGAASRQAGPFKDEDTGLAKKLYSLITDDQAAVVERHGVKDLYDSAKNAVVLRKGIEDDLTSLFGREVDGSLIKPLSGAVKGLAQGDTSKLINMLNAVPANMRQEVTASGLALAFNKASARGEFGLKEFSDFYSGLLQNKKAYSTLMTNLPSEARKNLSDLYRVTKAITASSEVSKNAMMGARDQLKAADGLIGQMLHTAMRLGLAKTAIIAGAGVLGNFAGGAIAGAILKGEARTPALKAVDTLIASPEFIQAVRTVGKPAANTVAVKKLAYSQKFKDFYKTVGSPQEMSNREQWILRALQVQDNRKEQKSVS